jgi:thiol-disulfide isomerase/thioredoxin
VESEGSEVASDFEIIVYQGQHLLGGDSVRLSELLAQGKPVVVILWAGLCPVCRAEMPGLQDAFDKHGESVTFIAVDIGTYVGLGSEEDARALLADLGITIPAGRTPDASVLQEYRVLGTPTTLFLSPDGAVATRWTGPLTSSQLDGYLTALVEVPAGS